jgi:hypothetical protein
MSTEHDFSGIQGYTLATIPESSFRQTVEIAAGARQSFYVTLRASGTVLHSYSTPNTIVTQDDNLIIYNGPANDYPFSTSLPGNPWNGALIYSKRQFTLQSPLCAANNCWMGDGQMFDVVAKNFKVSITAMKVYIYVGAIAEVWTKVGTHVGYEYSSLGWTKIAGERCKIVHHISKIF